jgi:type I restriction enzyme M protein
MKYQSYSAAFNEIRNYLAGRAIGISRDESLLHEVVKCLFCKILISQKKTTKSTTEVSKVYRNAFQELKDSTHHIFGNDEELLLDPNSISFVDKILSTIDLLDPMNDPLSELYQTFVGSEVRGADGQFFTPTEAVKWLVEAISPQPGEKIIDPACGAGSFLSFAARHLRKKQNNLEAVNNSVYGIEKDKYLATLANTHIALTTLRKSNVHCGDSIERVGDDGLTIPFELDERFDVVFANPPFGSKIKIGSDIAKRAFELSYKWKKSKDSGRYVKTETVIANPTPQVLFLELCIKLLRPGGRLGIVVPESMISSSTSGHVVQYLLDRTDLLAVVGMPENLFKTSGRGGTHTKTCLLVARKKRKEGMPSKDAIFMAEAKWCGHDSRGNIIPHNDLPTILANYLSAKKSTLGSTLGYKIAENDIVNFVLAPRYYDPASKEVLRDLYQSHDLLKISDLVSDGVLEFSTGDEIGKLSYGTGTIPFIRTSDISNWEIKTDQKHGVSEEIYSQYAEKQDVRESDILMVRDGTYLIGTCAYISKYNTKMLYQSHLYKIRVKKPEVISPYLLLAALSCKQVASQIQSKRFTQDIIDSIGKRVFEIILPIPKDPKLREQIENIVRKSIHDRIEARELARLATILIADGEINTILA